VNADKVLIDIGTGFFVEKVRPQSPALHWKPHARTNSFSDQTLAEAVEYKDRKAKFVIKNAQQVSNVLENKSRDLAAVDQILQRKLEVMQQSSVLKPQ
jgi:prefoldin subunit 5